MAVCDLTVKRNSKVTESTPSCTLKISDSTLGLNGWYVGNVNVEFASKTTTNGSVINGFVLGTSENYAGNTVYTVTKDGTTTVYGYVKDSNGNTATCSIAVKKDQTKPSCSLKVTDGTFNSEGYYTSNITIGFNSKVDSTSGISGFGIGKTETYAGNTSYIINTVGKHTVYGYVKDNAGNTAICSITVEKRNGIEYQYKKEIPTQFSNWSDWTTNIYYPDNPPKFGNYSLIEIVDLGKTQEVDDYKYSVGDPIYQQQLIKVGTIKQTYCTGYNYYRSTSTTTTTTYAVKESEDWKYVGRVTTSGTPINTLAVKYEFVGWDWGDCESECIKAPRAIWNKYTRTVYTSPTSNTIQTTTGIVTSCAKTETKEVEIFGTVNVLVGYEELRTPIYRDVYKFKERRRTVEKEAYTDYKWSTYNDKTLLEQGYSMTGVTRVVD